MGKLDNCSKYNDNYSQNYNYYNNDNYCNNYDKSKENSHCNYCNYNDKSPLQEIVPRAMFGEGEGILKRWKYKH